MATKTEAELKEIIDRSHKLFAVLDGLQAETAVAVLETARDWLVKHSLGFAPVVVAETVAGDVDTFIDIANDKGFLI
jgi:hypothetical protein